MDESMCLSLVNRDLMHLVGEGLRLQLGVFIAQGRKRLAHLHQLPPTLPFEGFLFLLEAPLLVYVGADTEDHVPPIPCSPDQLIKGLRWGVAGGEDTGRYDGRERRHWEGPAALPAPSRVAPCTHPFCGQAPTSWARRLFPRCLRSRAARGSRRLSRAPPRRRAPSRSRASRSDRTARPRPLG